MPNRFYISVDTPTNAVLLFDTWGLLNYPPILLGDHRFLLKFNAMVQVAKGLINLPEHCFDSHTPNDWKAFKNRWWLGTFYSPHDLPGHKRLSYGMFVTNDHGLTNRMLVGCFPNLGYDYYASLADKYFNGEICYFERRIIHVDKIDTAEAKIPCVRGPLDGKLVFEEDMLGQPYRLLKSDKHTFFLFNDAYNELFVSKVPCKLQDFKSEK